MLILRSPSHYDHNAGNPLVRDSRFKMMKITPKSYKPKSYKVSHFFCIVHICLDCHFIIQSFKFWFSCFILLTRKTFVASIINLIQKENYSLKSGNCYTFSYSFKGKSKMLKIFCYCPDYFTICVFQALLQMHHFPLFKCT